jgi:hypothetical protein
MMPIHIKLVAVAACAATLSGCAGMGSGAYQVENATGQPMAQHALADEVFLDGTGVTARRLAHTPSGTAVDRHYAEPMPPGAPTRAVARSRPTAIERSDNLSSSTTGSRNSAQNEANKPFSDQWWEKERREDARLKRVMDICRGC